MVVEILIF
ncbi:hypothetical protein F383_36412 [Gossypium arboreum]|uniref:Uncharacterized protein n=1 Tax=Gossypium arboreum TaxID=29729 RepID=A0A0B0Q3E8_GOSAR|nr:hypothetical protein F383_36412 [Gossypium arboreum]